jgi:N-acetyl-gamma-glutamyl-phosphate reductase
MQTVPIGILGASGYSGLELSRILAGHPHAELRVLSSDKWAGETAGKRAGLPGAAGKLKYVPWSEVLGPARECAAIFLALPAEQSMEIAPRLLELGIKVVDLSGAFRLKEKALYPKFYSFEHSHPSLLSEAAYGLPELSRVAEGARLVANPGCYATAAALALAPLIEAKLIEGPIICDAASGVTGAGRKASEEYSFVEIASDFRAYKVLRHQHTPEIAQTIGAPLTFTPHLLPVARGILATCYARLSPGRNPNELNEAYLHKYATAPFVDLAGSPDEVSLKAVVGTNRCQLAVACRDGTVVAISSLDNLVKGAAGQAVQNLNLVFGWPETDGLTSLRGFHP